MGVALGSGKMKVSLVFRRLPLFLSLIWICSGEQPVYVRCSPSLLLARVKWTAFDNDLVMTPDEVFLGEDCPVTSIHHGFYEFRYHPSNCNIVMEVLPGDRILFVSKITFISMFSEMEASIPVACTVPRHPAPIKTKGYNANKEDSPPKRSGRANLYFGRTINWKLESNCHCFKNVTAHLPPPETSEAGTISRSCGYLHDTLETGILPKDPVYLTFL